MSLQTIPETASIQQCCIPEKIFAFAERSPQAFALSFPQQGRKMTYGELAQQAKLLAERLQSLGVGPESVVAICLERSFDYVVSALAAWKAGAAYLPIDPGWPPSRRAFVIEDAQARVLVTRASVTPLAQASSLQNCAIVNLDAAGREQNYEAPGVGFASPQSQNLAYVVYTSGSTGEPKGVEITHANLVNMVSWFQQAFSVTSADRASHIAGLAFDAAVWEIWPMLAAGGEVALVDEATRNSADHLREWLCEQGITVASMPTVLAEPMMLAPWPEVVKLRCMLVGGDTLHRYPPAGLPFQVFNNYGPTECTVVATSGAVPAWTPDFQEPPTIGFPVANVRIYLLNSELQPVANGETGEIFIGGAGVGRGYRNRADLTASRFLPDPFSEIPGARMYRSGDLGSLHPGGQIDFRGRVGSFEKIRGHRIEPEEIAAKLDQHPSVLASAVIGHTAEQGERQLVAYVVPRPEAAVSGDELRDFLGERLPEYMIPSAFVKMAELPFNVNGKLDRSALPQPCAENMLFAPGFRFPESPVQVRIAGILAELLKVERVGLDDNFFLMGGHSLLGTQLVLRLREQFGVELTLRHIFKAQTVAKLAEEVEQAWIARLETMSDEDAGRMLAELESV